MGFEAVKVMVQRRRAQLVLTASDLSERTVKELRFHCARHGCEWIGLPCDSHSVTKALGYKCGCLALCDRGFADRAKELLQSARILSHTEEEC